MPDVLPVSEQAADRLKQFRTVRKITGQELADGLTHHGYPLTRSVLANIENKRIRSIPVDLIMAAMKFFEVSFQGFFSGPLCTVCDGHPPSGFTCNMCGTTAQRLGDR